MTGPYFTVVMPTRNRADMLRAAFKSLQWQTFGDFEVVAMDDGSKDGTPKVFEEFSRDPRFSFHRFEPLGVPKCRNFALRRARGRFITFLDDDDVWLPRRLEEFKKAAQERPDVGFWYSNSYVWRFDRVVGLFFDPARAIPEGRVPAFYAIGEKHMPYVTTNMSIARSSIENAGFFHEDIPILADTEMVVRLLAAGAETGVLRRPLAVRRLHDAQVTRDHIKAFEESRVVLASARMEPAAEAALRRELALEAATYLIKGIEPEKARRFLKASGIPHDASYWKLYAGSLAPRPLLSALRIARKALLRSGPRAPVADAEFTAVEALVRPIL